jgi:AraC family transcriptional regulator
MLFAPDFRLHRLDGNVSIVGRDAFRVIGVSYRGVGDKGEIPHLWSQLWCRQDEILGKIDQRTYGLAEIIFEDLNIFEYVAGYAVSNNTRVPEGMVSWRIPEKLYAVFTCRLSSLLETIHYIYQDWLPNSGFSRSAGPEFESYGFDFDSKDINSTLDYFLPIEEANKSIFFE